MDTGIVFSRGSNVGNAETHFFFILSDDIDLLGYLNRNLSESKKNF